MEDINKDKVTNVTNKSKKRLILLSIIAVVILVAIIALVIFCGENEKLLNGTKASNFVTAIANEEFYIKMIQVDSKMKDTGKEIEYTKDGDDYAIVAGGIQIILKGEKAYAVSSEEKMVVSGSKDDLGATGSEPTLITDTTSVETPTVTTETINDKEYTCETYNDLKLYFDGNTITYIMTDGTTIRIIEFKDSVNKDLFSWPSDYKVMSEKDLQNGVEK